jgi:hypothetical protein
MFRDGHVAVAVVVLTTALTACNHGDVPVADVVQRNQIASWEKKELSAAGVTVDVPNRSDVKADAISGALVRIHRVRPSQGVLDDANYLVEIELMRMSESEFNRKINLALKYLPEDEKVRQLTAWNASQHETVSTMSHGQYFYYRLDVICSNEDVIRGEARRLTTYLSGVAVNAAEDDAIVRRILQSVECIESAQ